MGKTSPEKVIALITDYEGNNRRDRVTLDARLAEDLELDSLDKVYLSIDLEEDLGIQIPDEVTFGWKTVKDISDYVDSVLASRGLGGAL